ncbi:MAG TPA: hypothetical protein VF797_04955, partial [Noviherbaspirillum sp.]
MPLRQFRDRAQSHDHASWSGTHVGNQASGWITAIHGRNDALRHNPSHRPMENHGAAHFDEPR